MALRFSVITPSFNQAEFLPRTLQSVAAQSLKPIEHLVFDPGSSDASREIVTAADGVTLIAEPDKGQADAVANGMLRAEGDVIAWLNSDDEYFDDAVFAAVAEAFASDSHPDIVFGDGDYVGKDGAFLRPAYVIKNSNDLEWRLAKEVGILQPATFISKKLIERIGPVDRDLNFCMDYEFWIRAHQSGATFMRLDRRLAKARYYADNKTLGQRGDSLREVVRMLKRKFGFAHIEWVRRLADFELYGHDGIQKNFANSPVDVAALDRKTNELNRLINGDELATTRLRQATPPRIAGKTSETLQASTDAMPSAYAKRIAPDATAPGSKTYVVGPQKWAFDNTWLNAALQQADMQIEKLSAQRSSDTCVIVGNGPSLKLVDLDRLEGADVFITNYAFLNKSLRRIAKYLCVTNYLVAEQEPESFNLLDGITKFAPYWLSYSLLPTPNTAFIRSVGHAEFGVDYKTNISWRSTVSFFSMQIAYALGYRKVLLTGFDHSYVQPKSVEGDLIDQKEDDPNHFDPRYFKGKTWQAADTDNMEAMYVLAKKAFERDGREIVNCTVGGKLELFRRGELQDELAKGEKAPPRVLLLDHTRIGDGTATGELKASLFARWPSARIFQVHQAAATTFGAGLPGHAATIDALSSSAIAALRDRIDAFNPEIIVYRPVPQTDALHNFAMELIGASKIPLATWIMDDWPAAGNSEGQEKSTELERDWRLLLANAHLNLCISEQMAVAFSERYGARFAPLANGVAPEEWDFPHKEIAGTAAPITIRYAGSLSENMGLSTLLLVAQAVEQLGREGVDIRLEINTREYWQRAAATKFIGFTRTTIRTESFKPENYRQWLSDADIALIAYNFDEKSKSYVKYSLANKLPECLASGAAVVAIGPSDINTMQLLEAVGCVVKITDNALASIKVALAALAADAPRRADMAKASRALAFDAFNIRKPQVHLQALLTDAARAQQTRLPFAPNSAKIKVDEIRVARRLMGDRTVRVTSEIGNVVQIGAEHAALLTVDAHELTPLKQTSPQQTPDMIVCAFENTAQLHWQAAQSVPAVLRAQGYSSYVSEWHPRSDARPHHCWRRVFPLDAATLPEDACGNILAFKTDPGIGNVARAFRELMETPPAETRAPSPPPAENPSVNPQPETAPHVHPLDRLRAIYAPHAIELRARSPQLFSALRFAKKMAGGLWRRRVATVPAFAIWTAFMLAGVAFEDARWLIWGLGGFALILGVVGYLALRVRSFMERSVGEVLELRAALGLAHANLHAAHEKIAALTVAQTTAQAEARKTAAAVSNAANAHRDAIALQRQILETQSNALASHGQALATHTAALAAHDAALDGQNNALQAQQNAQQSHEAEIAALKGAMSTGAAHVDALAQRLSVAEETSRRAAHDITLQGQQLARTDKAAVFNNATWYQRFNRRLKQEHVAALAPWTEHLPMRVTQHMIGYAAQRACAVEAQMHGRLATSIEDVLLRTYAAMRVERKSLDILEIGTLFGIGAGVMYDALAPHFENVHVTLLDPLDGYYEARKLDILTGQPVSESTLRKNLAVVDLTDANLTLIKALSSDPEALERAKKRQYDVLVIDGDHTYDGVKIDFELYGPLVRPGGVIIFDDYASEDWPDVQRYVDAEVAPLAWVERIGHEWRTCVYRVK